MSHTRILQSLCSSFFAAAMIALLSVTALTCAGCDSNKTSDKDVRFLEVNEAVVLSKERSGILALNNKKVGWIDARPAARFRQEHIPGAVNVTPVDLAPDDARLNGYDVLVVYGEDYDSTLATVMAKNLIRQGHKDVRTLRGGLRAWKSAGNETIRGEGSG